MSARAAKANGKGAASAASGPVYTSKNTRIVSNAIVQDVGDWLANVAKRCGGRATAKEVLLAAKDKSSPIHGIVFRESAKEAELQHRLHIVRTIMCSIEVVIHETPVPAFVNIENGTGYEPAETAYVNVDTVQALLELARRDAVSFYRKHARVREATGIAPVFEAIERAFPDDIATTKETQ